MSKTQTITKLHEPSCQARQTYLLSRYKHQNPNESSWDKTD